MVLVRHFIYGSHLTMCISSVSMMICVAMRFRSYSVDYTLFNESIDIPSIYYYFSIFSMILHIAGIFYLFLPMLFLFGLGYTKSKLIFVRWVSFCHGILGIPCMTANHFFAWNKQKPWLICTEWISLSATIAFGETFIVTLDMLLLVLCTIDVKNILHSESSSEDSLERITSKDTIDLQRKMRRSAFETADKMTEITKTRDKRTLTEK